MLNTTSHTVELTPVAQAVASRSRLARRWAGVASGVLLAATLAACGSNVKLAETPVQTAVPVQSGGTSDAAASAQAQAPSQVMGTSQASVEQRAVAGIEASGTDAAQPATMERIVYFDFDSYTVRDEFTATLEAHAKFLAANNSRMVALEGHADERGGREYNLALGQKRSEAVRRVLSVLGVNESQMEAVSFGEEKPAVEGFDEAAYAKNRRVELTYR
jgi:peptidoglycan-associated lipoprotein